MFLGKKRQSLGMEPMIVLSPSWFSWRRLMAGIFPWRTVHKDAASPTVAWLLHVFVWGVLLVLLWQVNRWLGLGHGLHSRWPLLHTVWLPLLAILTYLLGWLCVGMWHALHYVPDVSAWPD